MDLISSLNKYYTFYCILKLSFGNISSYTNTLGNSQKKLMAPKQNKTHEPKKSLIRIQDKKTARFRHHLFVTKSSIKKLNNGHKKVKWLHIKVTLARKKSVIHEMIYNWKYLSVEETRRENKQVHKIIFFLLFSIYSFFANRKHEFLMKFTTFCLFHFYLVSCISVYKL